MRPVRLLLIYIVIVFVGGALVAPWLYYAAQWAAPHGRFLSKLASNPFHRYVIRAFLVIAVAGLWPLLRGCGMLSLQELGLGGRRSGESPDGTKGVAEVRAGANVAADVRRRTADLQIASKESASLRRRLPCLGFAIGFASLAMVAILEILFGARRVNLSHTAGEVFHSLGNAAFAAVLVAVLEELIFRGGLFGILRKACSWPQALLVSSATYALVHFLDKAEPPGAVHWYSGVALLPSMFRNLAEPAQLFPAFFSLLLAGSILALAYQRTGTLYLSIGIHAGWIFWLKSYRFITLPVAGFAPAIWGGDKLIDGWLVPPVLGLLLLFLYRRPNTGC